MQMATANPVNSNRRMSIIGLLSFPRLILRRVTSCRELWARLLARLSPDFYCLESRLDFLNVPLPVQPNDSAGDLALNASSVLRQVFEPGTSLRGARVDVGLIPQNDFCNHQPPPVCDMIAPAPHHEDREALCRCLHPCGSRIRRFGPRAHSKPHKTSPSQSRKKSQSARSRDR